MKMSSLPTLDDLQSRVRHSSSFYAEKTTPLTTPILVTPSSILQEQESRLNTTKRILKKCTTVFHCSRSKSELPSYNPLQHKPPTRTPSSDSLPSTPGDKCFKCSAVGLVVGLVVVFLTMMALAKTGVFNKCPRRDQDTGPGGHSWFENATFYEIFPASFQDTDSDGYGDFQGIIQRLDYIAGLGATAIRLNSIFSALDYPLEFEHVIDLRTPDPHLGRPGDLGDLVTRAHARGLRVVLELNPTVTSDQHTWALHWQRGIPGYEHFYASHNSSKAPPDMENSEGPPPEDWELTQRTFGGHYVVNWSNPFVQREYRTALNHWLDTGVDGIYMKHLDKMHVIDKKDILDIVHQWRTILDRPRRNSSPNSGVAGPCDELIPQNGLFGMRYTQEQTKSYRARAPSRHCPNRRILIVSRKFVVQLASDFGSGSEDLKGILKDVNLLDTPVLVGSGEEMSQQVSSLGNMSKYELDGWPVPMWHLGSADTFRMASRIEARYQMAAFYLLMALPGAISVFYGDEIGVKDSFDVANGRVYRGGQLTPMQWTSDNSTSGGFTDNATEAWMPLNPEHTATNVQTSRKRLQEFTRLANYRNNTLRQYSGKDLRFDILEPNVVVLERTHEVHKSKKVLLAANFGSTSEEKEFPVAYANIRAALTTTEPTRTRVRTKGFTISPGAAFVAEVTVQHNSQPVARRDG